MLANKNALFKKNIITVLAAAVLMLPGIAVAENVVIDADFGSVTFGSSSTSTVTIITPPPMEVTITGFSLAKGTSSDFKVNTTIPDGGIHLAPGELFKIDITFTPSTVGTSSDTLMINSTDPIFFTGIVNLTGTGVEVAKSSAGDVNEILDFFDASVKSGALEGKGHGKSAKNNLAALRKMIKSAGHKIQKNKTDAACQKLHAILKKTDGRNSKKSSQDLVKGDATEELASMIMKLMQELGCKR